MKEKRIKCFEEIEEIWDYRKEIDLNSYFT